jgi:hypothetical protein
VHQRDGFWLGVTLGHADHSADAEMDGERSCPLVVPLGTFRHAPCIGDKEKTIGCARDVQQSEYICDTWIYY